MPVPVTFSETELPGVFEVSVRSFTDERGYFTEVYARSAWGAEGFNETFVQDNLSFSARGTLRGMHYQLDPHGQGKFIRVLRGSVFDVAVDLRRGSPHFGGWVGRTLSGNSGGGLWVPAGFAHGFLALEEETLVLYKCASLYHPESERCLLYNDSEVGIRWPIEATIVSEKDAKAPKLCDAEYNFEFEGS